MAVFLGALIEVSWRRQWYYRHAMPFHSPSKTVILLAEDEVSIRNLVSQVLTKEGYVVLTAANGSEAIERSRRFSDPIHLLLANIVMPEIDGIKLAEVIRRDRPSIKVVLITGATDKAITERNRPDAFLSKPFAPSELLQVIQQVLEAPRPAH